jgi:hypothetical protein
MMTGIEGSGRRALLAALVTALPLAAQDPAPKFQFSAFGTLGAVSTTTDQMGFRRDDTQPGGAYRTPDWGIDTRFGVQASAQISAALLGTVQVVSKWGPDGTWRPQVTEGCLAWYPAQGWTLKGGVVDTNALPTDEWSDVGWTYLWVRPPVDVFGTFPFTRMVGLDVRRLFDLGGGLGLEATLRGGKANQKVHIDHIGLLDGTGTEFGSAWLRLKAPSWRARIEYNEGRSVSNLPQSVQVFQQLIRNVGAAIQDPQFSAAAEALDTKGEKPRSWEVDAVGDFGPWQTEVLLSRGLYTSPTLPANWSGYASVGRSLGNVVPFVVFSRNVTRRTPHPDLGPAAALSGPLGEFALQLAGALDTIIDSSAIDRRTLSLGLRWDFSSRTDLKVQVDQVRSHNAVGLFYNPAPTGPMVWNGHMTVFTVTLDFILGGGR